MTRILGRTAGSSGVDPTVRDWRESTARMGAADGARSRAASILLHARAQARTIVSQAWTEAEAEIAELRRQAWDRGHAEGFARGQRDVDELKSRMAHIVSHAALAYEQSARNLDDAALSVVMAVAETLVRQELAAAPEAVMGAVAAALAELSLDAAVTLRLHPLDAALVGPHLSTLDVPASVDITVVPDEAMTAGGCIVESGAGRVDARVESQLARMESLLRERLHAA